MIYVAVWTGLRVSELIGLKWRCLHDNSITIEERYGRGDWSVPKTDASAATIGVEEHVITRLLALKNLTIEVRAGRAIRSAAISTLESRISPMRAVQAVRDGSR
jgi:integrase